MDIEMLRNRAIAENTSARLARMDVSGLTIGFKYGQCSAERLDRARTDLACAEGAAAGALYALRLAEADL